MKRKLVTAAAVSLALAGATGSAIAEITGVPAEAQLGPMVLHDPAVAGNLETYIALTVPSNIGTDTVVNLSAPNVLANGPAVQNNFDPRIDWVLFDENSKKVEDGNCEVSPGDTVMWTTDVGRAGYPDRSRAAPCSNAYLDSQALVCGPSQSEALWLRCLPDLHGCGRSCRRLRILGRWWHRRLQRPT